MHFACMVTLKCQCCQAIKKKQNGAQNGEQKSITQYIKLDHKVYILFVSFMLATLPAYHLCVYLQQAL